MLGTVSQSGIQARFVTANQQLAAPSPPTVLSLLSAAALQSFHIDMSELPVASCELRVASFGTATVSPAAQSPLQKRRSRERCLTFFLQSLQREPSGSISAALRCSQLPLHTDSESRHLHRPRK